MEFTFRVSLDVLQAVFLLWGLSLLAAGVSYVVRVVDWWDRGSGTLSEEDRMDWMDNHPEANL